MDRLVWQAVLAGAIVGGDPGAAAAQEFASRDTVTTETLAEAAWVDPDEASELLTELAASGMVLSSEDWQRLALSGSGDDSPGSGSPSRRRSGANPILNGRTTWRTLLRSGASLVHRGHLQLRYGSLTGKMRWDLDDGQGKPLNGSLDWSSSSWRVLAGSVGWEHGLGLFCAAPGRWRGLSVTTSLVQAAAGPVAYAGRSDPHALSGAVVRGNWGRWGMLLVTGRPPGSLRGATRQDVLLGGFSARLGGSRWAGLWGRQGEGRGGSLALEAAVLGGCVRAEYALWKSGQQQPIHRAWAMGWQLDRPAWRLEMQAIAADAAGAPLAQRPTLLPTWLGWGWAVRGYYNVSAHSRLFILLSRGRGRITTASLPETETYTRIELAYRWRLVMGLTCEVHHRESREMHDGWQERYPWLAPARVMERRRSQTRAALKGRWWLLHWSGSVRTLAEERVGSNSDSGRPRRRNLVGVQVDWCSRAPWEVRAAWYWAWGDDVDLVSVAGMVPGYVTLRHWGRWASEVQAAVGWCRGGFRLQSGVSQRQPVPAVPVGRHWEGLVSLTIAW